MGVKATEEQLTHCRRAPFPARTALRQSALRERSREASPLSSSRTACAEGASREPGRSIRLTAQSRYCGNSVCPPLAAAIMAANYAEADVAGEVAA